LGRPAQFDPGPGHEGAEGHWPGEEVHRRDEPAPPRPVRRPPLRGRRRSTLTMRRITLLVIEAAALACVITCVAALTGDDSRLPFPAGVVVGALIVAAWVLSRPRLDGGTRSRPAP
jgi:hypothetical protein